MALWDRRVFGPAHGVAGQKAGPKTGNRRIMTTPRHFVFILVEDFSHLAFSCALEPLRIANHVAGAPLYRWSLISPDGRTATSSNGEVTLVHGGLEPTRHADRLFVISGTGVQSRATPDLLRFLRRERSAGTQIGGICSGAYILAAAGFLDGEEAAIHWDYHDVFAENFPETRLVRSVFVANGRFTTASGGTAAADLMLHLIGLEHGADLAIAVADQMVYNAVRSGSDAQRVSLQSRHGMRNAHLIRAIALIEQSVEEPIAICDIADNLGISARQLERLFRKYLNCSPKRYIMEMRLHRARNLLVQSELSVTEIAMACGFSTTSHFSKVFRGFFGRTPFSFRAAAGALPEAGAPPPHPNPPPTGLRPH